MNDGLKKIILALLLSMISLGIGVTGFMLIEGYSFLESIYMTIITLSTVGFKEVRPLSDAGMIFLSVYILLNIGLFAYLVSHVVSYVFEGELKKQFLKYVSDKDLKKMKNHVIVCGFGRNGKRVCEELKNRQPCILIDQNPVVYEEAKGMVSQVIIGEASMEEVLHRAGIERANAIILALPNDADNVFITLSAREFNPDIMIISRASNEFSMRKLRKAGADEVILPYDLGGKHMAQLVTKPAVIEFLNMLEGAGSDFLIDQVLFDQLKPAFHEQSIKEMNIRDLSGVTVVAHKKSTGEINLYPDANEKLREGETFVILGTSHSIGKFKNEYTG